MALDIYSTRAQLAAIDLMPREYTFLYDTFVADMGAVEDDKAIYDYRKGTTPMAPFVVPGTGGVLMGRDGFQTREIGFCTIAPERIVTLNDLKSRMFNEKILGAMTPEQRAKKMFVEDMTFLRKAIQRRREWMARQVLLTGKLDIHRYTNEGRDKETTLIADYGFTNTVTLSGTNLWSNAASNIDKDMRDIFDMVYEGLGVVDTIVMAPDVANAMRNHSKFMDQLNKNSNINVGDLNSRYKGQGVRYEGTTSDGVDMYSLSGKFLNDAGQMEAMIPAGTMIAGSKGMLKCVHGPITQVEESGMNSAPKTYIKNEVPLRIGSVDANTVKQRLTSCPTIVPFNVDAWAVAHVL